MTQKIKFNRGPNAGKRLVVQDHEYRIEVMKPPSVVNIIERKEFDPTSILIFERGSYQKSNKRLKDGTWVYEWMGWYGE